MREPARDEVLQHHLCRDVVVGDAAALERVRERERVRECASEREREGEGSLWRERGSGREGEREGGGEGKRASEHLLEEAPRATEAVEEVGRHHALHHHRLRRRAETSPRRRGEALHARGADQV